MRRIKPISPKEVEQTIGKNIPDTVIVAVNNLLRKTYKNGCAHFTQIELIKEIRSLDCKLTSAILFKNDWLDIEPVFEREGWIVDYDNPGFNETYEASFTFTKSKLR